MTHLSLSIPSLKDIWLPLIFQAQLKNSFPVNNISYEATTSGGPCGESRIISQKSLGGLPRIHAVVNYEVHTVGTDGRKTEKYVNFLIYYGSQVGRLTWQSEGHLSVQKYLTRAKTLDYIFGHQSRRKCKSNFKETGK